MKAKKSRHSFAEEFEVEAVKQGTEKGFAVHWAMDRYLIAPDTDYRWRVSRSIDGRIPDYRVLTELEGKPLFLPREARMYPKREAIAWRLARLER